MQGKPGMAWKFNYKRRMYKNGDFLYQSCYPLEERTNSPKTM